MADTNIGGFLLKLGINIDKPAFETGHKLIDGTASKMVNLIGVARNVSVALAGMAKVAGVVEGGELKTAAAIGISAEQLNKWKIAANIAGVNANALVGSMAQLENKMQDLTINGRSDNELATNLGLLDINFNEFADMDSDKRLQTIIKSAKAMDDQAKAARIVGLILGQAGQDFYNYLGLSKISLDELLAKGEAFNFTTEESKQKALDFNTEFNTTTGAMKSIGALLGSEVGAVLTPLMSELNKWIKNHGDEVADNIKKIAEFVGAIANKIAPKVGEVVEAVVTPVNATKAAATDGVVGAIETAKLLTGGTEEEKKEWRDLVKEANILRKLLEDERRKKSTLLKPRLHLNFDELSPELQGKVKSYYEAAGSDEMITGVRGALAAGSIHDGIVAPGGHITQVDPNDWVFAAKDVSDLAQAFLPTGLNYSAPSSYVINQSFTINGAGNEIPQIIKQQAFMGTQNALLQSISQGAERLQLIPGLK